MRRRLTLLLASFSALFAAPAAWAQDDGAVSWFEMFVLSEDMLGQVIIVLLLLLSALGMGFAIMLAMQYRRSVMMPEATQADIEALLAEKKYRDAIKLAQEDPSYLGKLTAAGLNEASNGYGAMERAIEEAGDAETTRYLRPVEYLNVLGNIAPMIGLFGTVYGMIRAFQELVAAGGNADVQELAGGISTALVTTFWGLIVAIPALAAYALIRNRVDALSSEGLLVAEELISPFKPSGKRSSSSSKSASSSSSSSSRRSSSRSSSEKESGDDAEKRPATE